MKRPVVLKSLFCGRINNLVAFVFVSLMIILSSATSVKGQCTVSGVSGSGFLFAQQCAPVTTGIYYEFTFFSKPPETTYRVLYFWGDGTSQNTFPTVQWKSFIPGDTTWYVRAELTHTFPADGLCEYNTTMVLVDNGFQCFDSRQVQIIGNWHQDDQAAAFGVIALNPLQRDVCVGQPLIDFPFADATNFACNIQDLPDAQKPNHTARHQQFVYGTNPIAGRGIPNLYIKVGTAQTIVYLTDADGNPVPNSWNVDPVTGGNVPNYTTQSGYFEGPVVQVPVNSVTGTYTLPNTYPISFDGVGTVFQDQFEVTVRNWNVCNPWNGSQTTPNAGDANTGSSIIFITDGPIAEAGAPITICADGTAALAGQILRLATAGFWTTTGDGSFTNPSQPTGATYTPGPNDRTNGSVWLILTATSPTPPCNSHQDSVLLTIIPIIANNTVAAAQTICSGATPVGLTGSLPTGALGAGTYAYQWQSSTTSAVNGFSNIGGATSQNYLPGALTQTTWYRRVVTSGPCTSTSTAIEITVRPLPTATISAPTPVCQGETRNVTITNPQPLAITVTYNRDGGANQNMNIAANGSATVAIPTGSENTYTYNLVSVRYQAAPTCPNPVTSSVTVVVRRTPTATITGSTTVCLNDASPNITFTNTSPLPIRIRYRRNGTTYTIASVAAGATATVAVPTGSATTYDYNIRDIRYADNNPGCLVNNPPGSASVTIRPNPAATISGGTTVCQGDAAPNITFTNTRNIAEIVTYNINGGPDQTINVPASGTATVTQPTGAAGTFTYNLVSAQYQTAPSCSFAIAGSTTVTVRPTPTATISGNASVCQNAPSPNVTFTNPMALPVTVTYNINGGGPQTINIAASTTATVAAPTGTAGIFNYNLVSVQYQAAPNCPNTITGTATVTVNPNPTPVIAGINNVCAGAVGVTYTTANNAGSTYNWQISGGSITAGNGTNTITVTWGAAGNGWVRVTETYPTTCATTTADYPVTINPGPPTDAATFVTAPANICRNGTINIDVTDIPSAIEYVWDYDWVAGEENAVTGTSDISIDLTGLAPGVYRVRVQGRNGCGTGPFSGWHTFTINDIPVLSTLSNTVCSDDAAAITLSITNEGVYCSGITYTIVSINNGGLTPGGSNATTGSGKPANAIAGDTWTNKTNANVDVIYNIVPVSAQGCSGAETQVTLTVRPEPVLDNLGATRCSRAAIGFNLNTAPGSVAAANYNITNIQPNGLTASAGAPVTGIGLPANVIADDAWLNTTNAPVNVVYTIVPVSAQSCAGDAYTMTIVVNPEPTLANLSTTVCSDAQTSLNLSVAAGSVAAATYNITNINANGLTASAGTPVTGTGFAAGVIADDAWTNKTNAPVDVVYTVVPVSANSCAGDPKTVTVTINPEPTLAPAGNTVCSDEAAAITLSVAAGSVAAATYNIININNNGLSPSAGAPAVGTGFSSNVLADDAWTNKTGANVNVVYTVVPVSGLGCQGDPVNVTLTVRPEPVLANLNTTRCSDTPLGFNLSVAAGSVAAASYNITNINANGLTASAGAPATGTGLAANVIADDAWTNTTSAPVDVVYTIVPVSAATCIGDAYTMTITVNPEPVGSDDLVTICSGNALTYNLQNNINSNNSVLSQFTYTVSSSDPVNVPPAPNRLTPSSDPITYTYTNTTGSLVTVTYTVTPVSITGTCTGTPFEIEVVVASQPVLANLNRTACSGEPIGLILAAAVGSVTPDYYHIASKSVSAGLTPAGTAALPQLTAPDDYLANDRYINTTTGSLTVTYTIRPILAPDCIGDFVDVVVTILPPVLPGTIIGGGEVCYNEDAPAITNGGVATGGDGNITYYWYYTENLAAMPGDGNWTLIAGENGPTYDPGTLINSTKYVRGATDSFCPGEVFSNMVTLDRKSVV